jgi:predicted RNA binding protein YcfA (HicA-like mRNA interferase family)
VPLKPLSYKEVKRRLTMAGFTEHNQRGSHVKFVKITATGTYTAIVPRHHEVAAGTIRSILRQANISIEEWEALGES